VRQFGTRLNVYRAETITMNYIRTAPVLSRRHLLRGFGAMLPLPFLEAMAPGSARAAQALPQGGRPPVRLGLWLFPGGRVRSTWDLGYGSGDLKELSPTLKPFEPLRQHMLVLSGLSNKGKKAGGGVAFNGHETTTYQYLTCAGGWTEKGLNTGRSFDQIAAEALQEQTFLASLELSSEQYKEGMRIWRTPTTPVTPEANLREAYERMFKGRTPVVPAWHTGGAGVRQEVAKTTPRRKQTLQTSVIDLVLEDAKALRNKLGAADATRLDQYVDSVRTFERQLEFAERQGLAFAQPRGVPTGVSKPVAIDFGKFNEEAIRQGTVADHRMNLELMSDLMLLAFQTDTTRVVSLDTSMGLKSYPELCVGADTDYHPLQHVAGSASREKAEQLIDRERQQAGKWKEGDTGNAVDNAIASCTNINVFYSEVAARFIAKAAALPEAGGKLLDNCMIMYSSYMATGGHTTDDYGVVLFGGGGGTLKPGRHVAFEKDTPIAGLYAGLLTRMGVDPTEIIEVDKKTSPGGKYDLSELG